MAEATQTQDEKQRGVRKKAPDIKVAENLTRNKHPIDQLLADNPGQSFVQVPVGSSIEALADRGLEPVMVGGKPLSRKNTMIARCVDDTHERAVKEDYEQAENAISAVRKLEVSDVTSFEKSTTPARRR